VPDIIKETKNRYSNGQNMLIVFDCMIIIVDLFYRRGRGNKLYHSEIKIFESAKNFELYNIGKEMLILKEKLDKQNLLQCL